MRRKPNSEEGLIEWAVLDVWKQYHSHLNRPRITDPAALAVWVDNGDKLFLDLLFAIAQDVRFEFDRVQLKTSGYSPIAHGEIEFEQTTIRKLMLDLLAGKRALKMEVEKFPIDPEALKAQIALQTAMSDALTGDGALNNHIAPADAPGKPANT